MLADKILRNQKPLRRKAPPLRKKLIGIGLLLPLLCLLVFSIAGRFDRADVPALSTVDQIELHFAAALDIREQIQEAVLHKVNELMTTERDLGKLSNRLASAFGLKSVAVSQTSIGQLHISLVPHLPVLKTETPEMFVSEDGLIFKDSLAFYRNVSLPKLVFQSPQESEATEIILEAAMLAQQFQSLLPETIFFDRNRGFSAQISALPTTIVLGRKPFEKKILRIGKLIASKNMNAIKELDLDYKDKAFLEFF